MYHHTDLPLIEEIDTTLSPVMLFDVFKDQPDCFWLDSAMDPSKLGRFSLMGSEPFVLVKSRGNSITLIRDGKYFFEIGNPLDTLCRLLNLYHLDVQTDVIPCTGGAVGYFSYDLCRLLEKLPVKARDDLNLPECILGFYDLMLVFDNLLQKTFIVSTGFPEIEEKARSARARDRLNQLKQEIRSNNFHKPKSDLLKYSGSTGIKIMSNFNHEDYLQAITRARQYIIDGDIYEVNLSQRFETELPVDPYELYLRLRNINPAPFSAYLDFDELKIVGSSPERFLRLNGDLVETRPIKGTIRRGRTPLEDQTNACRLQNSVKDHAENMMIVDLERNDLGKACRIGTVKVSGFAELETFPTVFHLTSRVEGQLRENVQLPGITKSHLSWWIHYRRPKNTGDGNNR